ncbi:MULTISPECIES: ATP-binding cassette domain-containing protein [unclassified Actinopolyspora]|uniref:ATP-binding cassette domain-containing protein n=1 Tax=unclassified Actinopolyspora TaxID=2639451 RepID=UPI0013F5DD21|nr:ATP-binding cassette domain-containing protein [Actinopolyspora sp. BKK2]NHE78020.1 ATP-binding cassette domain-containing protein [Actinopolyspora sp. BKK1]
MHDGSGRILVQGLNKSFGPINAVQNLNFSVEPGSVTGFLGPNGSGKTTTLRMILGLVSPTAGGAFINGQPFSRLPNPATIVGAVLDSQGFHPGQTARTHLRCYTAALNLPDQQADQVLELVGLSSAATRKTGGFSLGMRQRLALATALLGNPQILILDEPANGLDPEGIAWLRGFLKSFASTGRTVLVSSHLLREMEHTVDNVVIVSRGQCVYNGDLEQLRAAQQSRVLVRTADPATLVETLRQSGIHAEYLPDGSLAVPGTDSKTVADLALGAGVAVHGMQEENLDLEQIFFQLTTGQYTGSAPQGPPQPGGPQPGGPQPPQGAAQWGPGAPQQPPQQPSQQPPQQPPGTPPPGTPPPPDQGQGYQQVHPQQDQNNQGGNGGYGGNA